ncbi:MAG: hypothetical protein R2783_06460 [Gelidibacter sp.]
MFFRLFFDGAHFFSVTLLIFGNQYFVVGNFVTVLLHFNGLEGFPDPYLVDFNHRNGCWPSGCHPDAVWMKAIEIILKVSKKTLS